MDKIIDISLRLPCEPKKAFEMFTVNELLESWLTVRADVEPKVGGKYELFWNPEDKLIDSTFDCKVTAIETNKFLSFEWKGPKQFKHFMNQADPLTHVVVFFIPCNEEGGKLCTELHIIHSGWRSSPDWEEARQWFEKAWQNALDNLKKQVNRS